MPRKELRFPHQVIAWLEGWGCQLKQPAEMILIGSAALLWHAAKLGKDDPLPDSSMDVDPITDDEAIAELAYDAMIGSEFELEHGWHVNLMPPMVLREFTAGWRERASTATYGKLTLIVPCAPDLIAAKLKRNEPRDQAHKAYAESLGLV